MFYQFPPVGSRVCLENSVDMATTLPSFLSSRQARFYDSGTAALAAAIKAAVLTKEQSNKTSMAEVILPAYSCPDLISAAVCAGVKPVLVDLEVESPWMDLEQLTAAITSNTVAIIGVNLFGISERWLELRDIAEKKGLILIEDSAQYFPGKTSKQNWQGDLTVLSFGRGKPVSLLGGGAVICNSSDKLALLPESSFLPVSTTKQLKFSLKVKLYNAIISPYFYWLPQSLPFLHLGETRFHALHEIKNMDQQRFSLLATNIRCYQDDVKANHRNEMINAMLGLHKAVLNLPLKCNAPPDRRLLRYPVLLDVDRRDGVFQDLRKAGLGASLMYPASLPKITGLTHLLDGGQKFPNAEIFAQRLITLPTHSQISEKDINRMGEILKNI